MTFFFFSKQAFVAVVCDDLEDFPLDGDTGGGGIGGGEDDDGSTTDGDDDDTTAAASEGESMSDLDMDQEASEESQ